MITRDLTRFSASPNYVDANGNDQILNCQETILLDCKKIESPCDFDESKFCYLNPALTIDPNSGDCHFSWQANDGDLINMEICEDDDLGNISCTTYSSSADTININSRSFTYSYEIGIINPDTKELEIMSCDGGELFCGEIFDCDDITFNTSTTPAEGGQQYGNSCTINWDSPIYFDGLVNFFYENNYYKAIISESNGSIEVPSNIEINFVYEIDGNICHTNITPNCQNLNLPDCSEFIYSIEENAVTENECLLTWNSGNEEISGTLIYIDNGVYNQQEISGINGVALIPSGVDLTAEYTFLSGNNSCVEQFWVECDTLIPDSTDYSYLCDLFTYDLKPADLPGQACTVKWQTDSSINLSLEICNEINGVNNCSTFTNNIGETEISQGYFWLKPTITHTLANNEIVVIECAVDTLECLDPPPIIIDSTTYCNLFGLIKAVAQDSSNSLLTFNTIGGDIETELDDLGFTIAQAEAIITQIDIVDYQFSFTNINYLTESSLVGNLYSSDIDLQSFNFYDWVLQLEDLSPIDLIGTLNLSVTLKDGSMFTCAVELEAFFEEETPPVEEEYPLPDLECGEDFDSPQSNSTDPLLDGKAGDIFYLNGFPIVNTVVNHLGNGVYSGTALIPVPLQNEPLITAYTNLTVNTDYVVTAGNIHMYADATLLQTLVTLDVPNYVIGGNFCVPSDQNPMQDTSGYNISTQLNDYGFGPDSLHTETGTIYDPNGFDINGNYYNGGGLYNEYGCSRDQMTDPALDPNGISHPCDPSTPNPGNTTFIETMLPPLVTQVDSTVNNWIQIIDSTLQTINCELYRDSINTIISSEGLNAQEIDLIKGKSQEYFSPGLSSNFISRPESIPNIVPRNEGIKSIEKLHQSLYDCDILENNQAAVSQIVGDPNLLSDLTSYIEGEIINWTSYELHLYGGDSAKFGEWILKKVQEYLKQNGYITSIENPKPNYKIEDQYRSTIDELFHFDQNAYSSALASADMFSMEFDQDAREELIFQFQQGDREINGINRGLLLEYIAANSSAVSGNGVPMVLPFTVGSQDVKVYIDNLSFTPGGVTFDAYLVIIDQESGQKIVLEGKDLGLSVSGFTGDPTLTLRTNIELRLTNIVKLIIKKDVTTASWSCGGLDSLHLGADMVFCKDFITPLKNDFSIDTGDYTLPIDVTMSSWMNFAFETGDTKPFMMTKHPEVQFDLHHLVVDFDSGYTPLFTPLDGYTSNFLYDNEDTGERYLKSGWRGFYLESLEVIISEEALGDDSPSSERIVHEIYDVLIDGQGVTGGISIGIPEKEKSFGGWKGSINHLSLTVINNNLNSAGFGGNLNIPIFREDMPYEATIYPSGGISLTISPIETANWDMIIGQVQLDNCLVTAQKLPGEEFEMKAMMSGEVSISGLDGELEISGMPTLQFSDLAISNRASPDYFSPGVWSFQSGSAGTASQILGFNSGIDEDSPPELNKFSTDGKEVGIPLGVKLGFLDQLTGIEMSGKINVIGKLETTSGYQKWVFDRVALDQFCAKKSFTGTSAVNICLSWYDKHPVFGKGFRGEGSVTFKTGPMQIEVSAIAQFGEKDGDRYFFIDALSNSGNFGIPLGPLFFNGFGGGFSYHMDSNFNFEDVNFEAYNNTGGLGSSFSGTTYLPNPLGGVNIRALTLFESSGSDKVLNGSAFLNVNINNGSVQKIDFVGVAKMLQPVDLNNIPVLSDALEVVDKVAIGDDSEIKKIFDDRTSKPIPATISGFIHLILDLDNRVFTGDMKVFLDSPGGILVGAGSNKELVNASVYFSGFDNWYINMGTPTDPCGAKLDLGIAAVDAWGYFDIGTTIPNFTGENIAQQVRDILGDNIQVNESLRKSGGGLIFGAGITVDIDLSVGIAKATASAGAGFDIMIRDFDDATCYGQSGPIGIDGWYMVGQVWAFIEGRLEFLGFDILSLGIAAILQGEFPNPTFINASLGVQFKILWKKYNKTLNMTLGERCALQSDDPNDCLGMEVISLIVPYDTALDVETTAKPEIHFAIPVGQTQSAGDMSFRINPPDITLTSGKHGFEIPFKYEFNGDKTKMILTPNNYLPTNDSIIVNVDIEVVVTNSPLCGDLIVDQSKQSYFKTGDGLNSIPEQNILNSYPLSGMYHFYKDERIGNDGNSVSNVFDGQSGQAFTPGFITLEQGMPELLLDTDEDYKLHAVLLKNDGEQRILPCEYDLYNRKIEFNLYSDYLENGQIYSIHVSKLKVGTWQEYIPPTGIAPTQEDLNEDVGNSGTEDGAADEIKISNKIFFRVSEHNTFVSKMEAINDVVSTAESENKSYESIILMPNGFLNPGSGGMLPTLTLESGKSINTLELDLEDDMSLDKFESLGDDALVRWSGFNDVVQFNHTNYYNKAPFTTSDLFKYPMEDESCNNIIEYSNANFDAIKMVEASTRLPIVEDYEAPYNISPKNQGSLRVKGHGRHIDNWYALKSNIKTCGEFAIANPFIDDMDLGGNQNPDNDIIVELEKHFHSQFMQLATKRFSAASVSGNQVQITATYRLPDGSFGSSYTFTFNNN